jgi:hypothetical protein
MYNINSTNNIFNILTKDIDNNIIDTLSITIKPGNYNVKNLRDYINSIQSKISLSYNIQQNTYTYKNLTEDIINIEPLTAKQFIGLSDETIITIEGVESNVLDMNYRRKMILKVIGVSYEVISVENIGKSRNLENSSILFWIDKSDIQPYQRITYNNEDGGDSFNYNLYDKNITHLKLVLEDENEREYTDCKDYNLILQFSIIKRDTQEMIKLTKSINDYLREITAYTLMLLEFIGLI